MICKKCNFQNEETAKFCKNCGTELTNFKSATIFSQKNKNVNSSKKVMRNGFGITGFVISLFALLSFIAFLIVIIQDFYSSFSSQEGEFVGAIVFAMAGFIFSYIGLSQKNKTKWQAITGLAISGIILIGLCFILICFNGTIVFSR